ncbi:MAG: type IV pilus assembly protein PilM [Microgenomates group bacterium]
MAKSIAIDIGTYSIKAISGKSSSRPHIERAVEVLNTTGLAIPTDESSEEQLGILLDSFLKDNDLPRNDVRLSLPETVVSTKVISIPPLTDAELASAIGWQAEQHIPIPPEELSLEYQVLHRPAKKDQGQMRVLLVGTRKAMVEHFINMFHQLGIEPTLLETQVISIARSLQITPDDVTTLVAHVGASSMNLFVIHQGELKFVITNMNGGQVLTRALESAVGLDTAQAEQYKRTYGLISNQFEGKVRDALLPGVRILTGEIAKSMQFFNNQNAQQPIKRVVLSGGSAMLPEVVQFVTAELGIEVLVASPFAGVSTNVPATINQPSMTVCMGLLQREL